MEKNIEAVNVNLQALRKRRGLEARSH